MDTGRIRKATTGMVRPTLIKGKSVGAWADSKRVYLTKDSIRSTHDNIIILVIFNYAPIR